LKEILLVSLFTLFFSYRLNLSLKVFTSYSPFPSKISLIFLNSPSLLYFFSACDTIILCPCNAKIGVRNNMYLSNLFLTAFSEITNLTGSP